MVITFSGLFKGKILGSMMILCLRNYLIQRLEKIYVKETWSVCYSWWSCLNFFSNGTQAKIQALKLLEETLPVVPLFWHLWNNFQFQLKRAKANYLSSGSAYWRLKNCKQASIKRVAYGGNGLWEVPFSVIWLGNFWHFKKVEATKRWSLMRGGYKGRFNCGLTAND